MPLTRRSSFERGMGGKAHAAHMSEIEAQTSGRTACSSRKGENREGCAVVHVQYRARGVMVS